MTTHIADTQQTATEFWGVWLNYKFLQVGSCQQKVTDGQDILWVFNASNKKHFLKLAASSRAAYMGKSYLIRVTDGATGDPIEGVTVGGVITDKAGVAEI